MAGLGWCHVISGIFCCLLLTKGAGNDHICDGFDYGQYDSPSSNDHCCHEYCAGGTCSGPESTDCVGKCSTWIEGGGPVDVLRGGGTLVQDGDIGTGSTIMAAYAAVDDMWPDKDYVVLDVVIPEGSGLTKSVETSPNGKVYEVTGEASTEIYGKVLNSLTYDNTAEIPDTRTRRVCFVVSDGKHRSNIKCVYMAVVLVNNHVPVVEATAEGEPYVEEGPMVQVLDSLTLSDKDHPTLPQFFMRGATVSVVAGAATDRVYVDVSSANGAIWIVGGNDQTTVTLSGNAPLHVYQQVLLTTKYHSTDEEPDLHPRLINFEIDDGNFTASNDVTVEVIGINDNDPEIEPGSSPDAFTEEETVAVRTPVRVARNLILDDPDKDPVDYIFSAHIFVCQGGLCPNGNQFDSPDVDYEDLNVTTDTPLEVTASPDKTFITIEGKAPKAEYQRVFRTLTYFNSRKPISCPVKRYIVIQANDGNNTGRALATVNIEFKNVNPPQLTATSTLAQFTEEGPPVPFAPDITPSDNDTRCNTSLLLRASFKTVNYDGVDNETLAVDEMLADRLGISHILRQQGADVVLELNGAAELRDYHNLMKTVTYQNLKDEPTLHQRLIKATIYDGARTSNELVFTITLETINDKEPDLKLNESSLKFTENGDPTSFGPAMLTDPDSKPCDQNINSMSVTIQNRLDGDKEKVKFDETLLDTFGLFLTTLPNGFRIAAPNTDTGAPIEQFLAIVDSAMYCNDADDPQPMAEPTLGQRMIVFKFQTNVLTSVIPTQTTEFQFPLNVEGVNDNNPVVDLNGNGEEDGTDYHADFTEEGPAVNLSDGLRITDKDILPNTLIHKATIRVVNSRPEDAIYVDNLGSVLEISMDWNTGTVTVIGDADKSTYELVLATAMYRNTADEPSRCYVDIEFQIQDVDGRYSPIATVNITIIKVCDPLILKLDYNSSTYQTTFSERDKTPIKVVNDMHFNIADDDSDMIVRGSINVVGFRADWQDILRVIGHPSPYQGVTIAYENGQLKFDGTASFAVYSTLIENVHYDNPDPCPKSLHVTLEFHFVDDCGAYNLPAYTTITIIPANDPPFMDLDTGTTQDPVEVTYQFKGISNINPEPLTLFPNALFTDCDNSTDSSYSLYIVVREAGDLETYDEMLIFDLDGTNLVVTNTTDIDNFQVTYWIRSRETYTALPQHFEMILRKVQYFNRAIRPFESPRELTMHASDGNDSSTVQALINMERIRNGPTVLLGRVMVDYTIQESPYKFEFLNFAGFNVLAGDISFLKGVIITITNAPMEGGQIQDYLMAPDISLLPSNWEIIGGNTTQLRMESIFPISFASAEDVKLLLENVTFVCTAVGRHPPRIVTIQVFDLEGPGEIKNVTIKVEPLNDPPEIVVVSANPKYTKGEDPVVVYSNVAITDEDDETLEEVTIVLTLNETTETCMGGGAGDTSGLPVPRSECFGGTENDIRAECLDFTGGTGIFTLHYWYSVHSLTLTITSVNNLLPRTKVEYEDLLKRLQYSNTATKPGNAKRILSLTVNDGKVDSDPPVSVYVQIYLTNDNLPVLAIAPTTATFEEGPDTQQPIIQPTSDVTITDPDCGAIIIKARVVLSGGGDSESLNLTGGFPSLAHEYYPENTTLTITGQANYEDVLKAVEYSNPDDEPGPDDRTATYSVFDGKHWSNVVTIIINFIFINDHEPMLDLDESNVGTGVMVTFNEGSPGVFIAPVGKVQVTDSDIDVEVYKVVVKLQDTLDGSEEDIVSTDTGVVRTKNATTFTFMFTPPKNLSATEAFIETLQYINNDSDPTQGNRQAWVLINDGKFDSNVAVTIIEVDTRNDPPMFNEPFSGSVAENSANGVPIVQVTAEDPDSDTLDYTIVGGNEMGHFEINSLSGTITTTDVSLDRETEDSYMLTVMASDGMLNDTTKVSITVTEENDTCPAFDDTPYLATIPSTTVVGTVVVSLVIVDDDLTANFQVSITSGNTGELFGIMDHNVVVAATLSGSEFTTFTLTVTLTDSHQPTCPNVTATVTIVVFSSTVEFQFSVNEEQPPGTEVGQMIDDPSFHNIRYDITDPPSAPFSINHLSVINTTAVLDREDMLQHTLTVVFTINAHQVTATVQITVDDINDNSPVFSSSSYNGSVPENETPGSIVVVGISASDEDDGTNAQLTLTASGTSQFAIEQNFNTGNIEIKPPNLNYEATCSYSFQVIATDGGGKSATADVHMIVSNVNEFPPTFDSFTDPEIPVTLQPGGDVITLVATDPDKCPTEPSPAGTISYHIVGDPGSFRIDSATGLIEVDSPLSVGSTVLTVRANDNDGSGMTSDMDVNITVTDTDTITVDLNGDGDGQDGVHTSVTLSESDPPEVHLVDAAATGVVHSKSPIMSVTITLTNPRDGANEKLVANPQSPITENYDAATHILTLSGSASAEDYFEALKTVKYRHDLMTDILTMTKDSIELDRIIEVTAMNINNIQSNTATATVKLEATVKCTGDEVVVTNNMLAQYAVATKIDCNFVIKCPSTVGCDINSLAVLTCLKEINGRLEITNTQVDDLQGLENVRSFQGLVLKQNSALTTTHHLQLESRRRRKRAGHLIELSGDITIQDCGVLDDVLGLREISRVRGSVHIDNNQLYNGLYGLEDLAHVDGNFILEMNNGLRNLTGLDGLIAIGGDFQLTNHNELKSVAGLENLERINGTLLISSNPELKNVDPLTQSLVRVGDNAIFLFNTNIRCIDDTFWNNVVAGTFSTIPIPPCP